MRGRETIFQQTVESGKPEPLIYFFRKEGNVKHLLCLCKEAQVIRLLQILP